MTEDYVSFETAKLLKEKGFDEPCEMFYNEHFKSPYSGTLTKNSHTCSCTAPTLQMAMKWLREEHNIWIEVSPEGKGTWFVDVYDLSNEEYFGSKKFHHISSYEEAYEVGIKYCLENLI